MSLRVKCILCGKKFIIKKDETSPLLEHIRTAHPDVTISKSDDDIPNSIGEEKQPLKSTKLNQNNQENAKDISKEILANGDVGTQKENYVTENFVKDFNSPEVNKNLNNALIETNSPGNDLKIICDYTANPGSEVLPRESVEKFIGLHYKQPQDFTEPNSPSKVTSINYGKDSHILYKRRYKVKGFPNHLAVNCASTEAFYKNSLEKWKPGKGTIFCPKCGANKHPTIKTHDDKVANSPLGAACILTCWPFCFLPCLFPPPAREYLHCSVCNHLLGVYDRKNEVVQPNNMNAKPQPSKQSVTNSKKDRDYAKESATNVKKPNKPKKTKSN